MMEYRVETKPPFFMNNDAGSFAEYTVKNRFTEILEKVLEARPAGSREQESLVALIQQIPVGYITDPFETGEVSEEGFLPEEAADWKREIRPWVNHRWIDLPFYFSEAYLYFRVLIAAGYYNRNSSFFQVDPYLPQKERELKELLEELAWEGTLHSSRDLYSSLILMLKGNRVDLSIDSIAQRGRKQVHHTHPEDLLIDHLDALTARVEAAKRIDIVLDNAGAELVCDLHFADIFLSRQDGKDNDSVKIVLHGKDAPIFVSDALQKDVLQTINRLRTSERFSEMGHRLAFFHEQGRLEVLGHYFWNGPCHFPALPTELKEQFALSDLVIFKGDANYRRLLEDRKWPVSTPLEALVEWFPADLGVLRTLKSEILVGFSAEEAKKLSKEDPAWLTSGKWGIAQYVPKNRSRSL
jgi:uncharacterized protein with ATP-grasp and redox domains